MDVSPRKSWVRRLVTGPASAIVAAIIGGVFSLGSAILPQLWIVQNPSPAFQQSSPPAASPNEPGHASPHLTYGTWTLLESKDTAGNDWSNSVLKFTAQRPTEDGLELEGFFEWREGETLIGKEYVRGNYVASTRNLYFEGQSVEKACENRELEVGSFSARLAEDNRQLIEGTWGSAVGHRADVPGTWRARR